MQLDLLKERHNNLSSNILLKMTVLFFRNASKLTRFIYVNVFEFLLYVSSSSINIVKHKISQSKLIISCSILWAFLEYSNVLELYSFSNYFYVQMLFPIGYLWGREGSRSKYL